MYTRTEQHLILSSSTRGRFIVLLLAGQTELQMHWFNMAM